MERFTGHGAAAVGTDKTILNLFNPAAAPTTRGRIWEFDIGSVAAVADQATSFYIGRTTALGTEASGFTPNNLDPAGPAGAYDFGVGHSAEPTYTASKQLFSVALNQRATFRWVAANDLSMLVLAATQNNGAGLKSSSSTGTPNTQATIFFTE